MTAERQTQENQYPGLAECETLWREYGTPDRVIGHCKAVSAAAGAMARRLNEKGFRLNVPLTEAAGWLHDIARADDYHWDRGADLAERLGYSDVADIIRSHMSYLIDSKKEEITETDLVCMADRMVKENRYVGPDERMDYIIEKAKDFPGAEENIRASFREIRALKQRIEGIIGVGLDDLLGSE
ncbi:HD domain-containing protein [Bacilliculturomica massiliensis]|uniref:HD domain-containing protein n=1 Tax=Bacilliculturomica massiliensis TaxID=1917867 RepID=UPI0013EF4AA3|nr:HD domain-containing protein [Bacilliculturomica massiliensis]